jgi:hypothetical protein
MSNNLIPAGSYLARATDNWALGESAVKQTPYARLEFEIQEGPYKGKRLTKDLYFTEKTWERAIESLRACGFEGDDISNLAGVTKNVVSITVEHEMMTDKTGGPLTDEEGHAKYRAVVAFINRDNRPKPMEATKLSNFRELMKARLQQANEKAAGPALGATGTDTRDPWDR